MADQDGKGSVSAFKGISWRADRNLWRARIKIGTKDVILGCFETESEAVEAYDFAAQSLGRKMNVPDRKPSDAIVRKVRPKLVELRIQAKLDAELQEVDPQIWGHGATEGIYWAQTLQKDPVDVNGVNQNDPFALAEALGQDALLTYDEHIQKYRTRAKRLIWIRAFIAAAKGVWNAPKQPKEPGRKSEPEHLSELLVRLQAKKAAQMAKIDDGGLVEGTTIGPNGEVWSADCNPETLARDNAKIAECQENRTGIFAMMDAIDRENAKKREVDAMLAEIL
jgi:hypothetical protein